MAKRNIESLLGSRAGMTAFVLASGASMDHLPPHMFDGKLVIGVNQVHRRYPCTFVVQHHQEDAQEVIDKGLNLVTSEYDCGERTWGLNEFKGDYYFYRHADSRQCKGIDMSALDKPDSLAISACTTAEAVHFAAHLGASVIVLAGADGGRLDGKMNFEGYNGGEGGQTQPEHLPLSEPLLQIMVDELRRRGRVVCSLNPFINFGNEGHKYSRPPKGDVYLNIEQLAAGAK